MEGGSRLLFVLFFADDRMDAESAEHISIVVDVGAIEACLLYTSPSPRDKRQSRMPSSA